MYVHPCIQVERIGPQHQAGSDSLLTSFTFLKLTESLFQVWGLPLTT